MAKLSEEAMAYEPKQIKTVADLEIVSMDMDVKEKTDVEFPYKFIIENGQEYKVPDSVLKDLKVQLEERPEIKHFKVKKAGSGLNTKYTVIILD